MMEPNIELASEKIGVLLCDCMEQVTNEINLPEISEWIMANHPETTIRISDLFCRKPNGINAFIQQHKITKIVFGACKRYEELFEEATSKSNLKPYHTKTIGLLERCFITQSKEGAKEKAKILLSAAISHLKQASEIPSENLRFTTLFYNKMSRRSFLQFPLHRTPQVIPTITHNTCLVAHGCDLCINVCPKQAITEEKRKIRINASKCESCAICQVTCPKEAIFFPLYSTKQMDAEMRSLISANSGFLEPRILLFTCKGSEPLLNELAEKRFSFPANLMVTSVPCIGMITPFIILRTFDLGAAGLGLVSCQGKCQSGFDLNLSLEAVETFKEVFRVFGIGSQRICAIAQSDENLDGFHAQLMLFAEKVLKLDPSPLYGKEPSELSRSWNNLSRMVKHIRNKLGIDRTIRVCSQSLPFWIITVEANKCSMCGSCVRCCPTEAISLKDDGGHLKLYFDYNLCSACGICLKHCPENAMYEERVLDLRKLDAPLSILAEDKMAVCKMCSTPFLPRKQIKVVSNRLSDKSENYVRLISNYCPNCRTLARLKNMKRTA